ncbi:MAG TPA: M1 family aminopeptidase, partial [Roseiflexaceae bacterium]|nr:M1 family aminopeptidase [Roseiflexaceae bacterium]
DAPPGSGWVARVVSHEVGHQWWPMQTATNEAREPWLDEGLTEYSGARYMSEAGLRLDFGNAIVDMTTFEQSQYANTPMPATLPAWEYDSGYGSVVYSKTALGLWTLENMVGTDRFRQAMAGYLTEYRFKHPTGADFRASLQRSLGPHDWFWDDFMNSTGVINYAAGPIETAGDASVAQVQRIGEVQAPVDIRITFDDGTQRTETWDGATTNTTFSFPATNRVRAVEIDPTGKLKAEVATGDNKAAAP